MDKLKILKDQLSSYNVLFVEDDEETLKNLTKFFTILFNKVYIAKNGKEGLDLYMENRSNIDIIFTDINMPVLSGYEMIKEIKNINPLQYIVVISAHQDLELYNRCLNLGLNGLVVKPIFSEKLFEILTSAVNTITYIHQTIQKGKYLEKDLEQYHNDYGIDALTLVPNKLKLDYFLSKDIKYSVILVNIDHFDSINCKYGYKTGDQIIKRFAELLLEIKIEYGCELFRLISDEFILLFDEKNPDELENIAKKVVQEIESYDFNTDVESFNLSCSIGISSGIGQEILRNANIALKETRFIGKEKFSIFMNNSALEEQRQNNLKWLKKIKKLIKEDAITPYYQAIVDNTNEQITIYECLARIHEINRVIKPHYFIENAKLFKLLPNITKVIVAKAFKLFNTNKHMLSINLTIDDLEDESICKYIIHKQKKYEIDPSRVILEFPESISIIKDEDTIKNFKSLQENGFKIALDDFGTNHANIKNLYKLHVDFIKIDGIYIQEVLSNENTEHIIQSIIKLAHSLGAKVIAEAVSSREIQDRLKELGIEYSQGFLFGKPKENIEYNY